MQDTSHTPRVTYAPDQRAIVITGLTISEPHVVIEARRWTTGRRGEPVTEAQLHGVDLCAFAEQALTVGAQAIAIAGTTQDGASLEALVNDLGARATRSVTSAAADTERVVTSATEAVTKAAGDARDAITKAGKTARDDFGTEVKAARTALESEITRLVGGESPELVDRLRPLLDSFGRDVEARSTQQIDDLLAKAARQFDPSDPTSPMAKHQAEIRAQQETLSASLAAHHKELGGQIAQLAALVQADRAAKVATATVASVTPLKGATYEGDVGQTLATLATALGDEFEATGTTTGLLPRCKKGDGVLIVDGGAARVVIEMHDGDGTRAWNGYLDEAERNRAASASLGIVPSAASNSGELLRVLGPRRLVLAYTPGDDVSVLRSAILLLRLSALAAARTGGGEQIEAARERLAEATTALSSLTTITKSAGTIRKSAETVEREAATLDTTLRRLLAQATAALAGAESAVAATILTTTSPEVA